MKLKINLKTEPSHTSAVTCLGWNGTDEIYSSGDDGQLLSWNVSHNEFTKITQLNSDILPTDLQFLSKTSGTLGKHSDVLLITTADGRFYIINRSGRIERTVEAHKGAILVGQWSTDGVGLMTGGEDGFVKIWSRSGMLRSTVVVSDNSIYSACWSSDSQAIIYTQGNLLVIKNLTPNSLPKKWIAHEGLVICVAWSNTDIIVSGGEDGRYKVWDNQGHQLYASGLHDNPISSVAWSPNGDLFAVGSYNTLRICDYCGWSRSLEKPTTGCIYKVAFSNDGTQIAGACANGQVLFAHILDRSVSYSNYIATVTERKTITVVDISNDAVEYLELPERVIQMVLKYTNLVATTPNQCYIYSNTNWNTPNVFELKDGYVTLLLLCQKHFLLGERSTIGIYNYQGRLVASPRWPNMKLDTLKSYLVALSSDTLAARDIGDPKTIYILDLTSNKSMNEHFTSVQHTLPVIDIALDQFGDTSNRKLALLDNAKDLYVVDVRSSYKKFYKIGSQIQSFLWNTEVNFLAAIQDTQLVVWYCPFACYDSNLLQLSSLHYDSSDLGRSPRINDFVGNFASIRRADGALVNIPISPFPVLLYKYVQENKWKFARCLCRTIDDQMLWACFAVLSTQSNNTDVLDMAEEAFAEIEQYDKVFYIQEIKQSATKGQMLAGQAQLGGSYQKAEAILLQNGSIFQAILLNLNLYNWNRALDLAIKHKIHIDTVVYKRQLFLEELGKKENNEMFLKIKESVPIDVEKIQQKLELEEKKLLKSNN